MKTKKTAVRIPPYFVGLALTAWLVAAPLSGQTMLGVLGGASIASTTENDESGAKSRVGFAAGAFLDVPVSPAFGIQLEGAYVQKGAAWDAGTVELDYVDIAVLLKAGTSSQTSVYAFAGPTIGIHLTCRVSAEVLGVSASADCDATDETVDIETLEFGAKGGVGAAARVGESVRLSLDVAYALGFSKVLERNNAKNRGFRVQAGVAFPLG